MKVVGIALLRYNEDVTEPVMLAQATELSSFGFFQRGTVKEMITFFNKTIVKRAKLGQRQSVQNEEYYVHVYMRADGLGACFTCDSEYPPRVAFGLLTRLLEDFVVFMPNWKLETRNEVVMWPQLQTDLEKYQDPSNADQIMKIQKNLDETRDVLHSTIDSVLQRGEKLEDLVEKSGELSSQSKLFYQQAKKANSCCVLI
jgi:synaptobrevin family protein YKT6